MQKATIGVIGLGVMGRRLAQNMARNGYRVAGFDLDGEKVATFAASGAALAGCETLEAFLAALETPRRILLMAPAGGPVDAILETLTPHLASGDLVIDGGNSHYIATERRAEALAARDVLFVGMGVSGGEYGALWGPSLMPGGQRDAWEQMRPLLEAVAARVDGEPCVAYIGPRGAGHYVKMVHNGIEYADMQLIAESYDLLHRGGGLRNADLAEVFGAWNEGDLESYLVEITAKILARVDEETGQPLVDLILDEAKHKGTGKWTSQDALDLGAPIPTINGAVTMRFISAYKDERVAASRVLPGPEPALAVDKDDLVATVRDALYAAKIAAYAQGFALLRAADQEYGYHLDYGSIAKIWRGGCIIRAGFLDKIRAAFARTPDLTNLLLDPALGNAVAARQGALRQVVQWAAARGIPALAMSAALAYYDGYRAARLPANLTQAQRDYFGAHTYRRVDREGSFHTVWEDLERPSQA
ncbi:MAG: NADP-dependent phosphogluconate dehydrogenase [Anaerolineae bacterium]|nr:NADP-dependent phosphogluconate dehydrogenase [Anaerolineae bacterium]